MERDRALTIHFIDGTHISFDFPEQKPNEAAKSIMLEEILKSPYVMVEADGVLLMYPVANIKSIQVMAPTGKGTPHPKAVIRGATIVG